MAGIENEVVGSIPVLYDIKSGLDFLPEIKRREVQDVVCDDVAVVLDRQQGAKRRAKKIGIRLHTLIDFVDEGLPLLQDSMDIEEYSLIVSYLSDPANHQPT